MIWFLWKYDPVDLDPGIAFARLFELNENTKHDRWSIEICFEDATRLVEVIGNAELPTDGSGGQSASMINRKKLTI